MVIPQKNDSERSPGSSSSSKYKVKENKITWANKKKQLVKMRLSGLDQNTKQNILEQAESQNMDKAIVCRPIKVKKPRDHSGFDASTSALDQAEKILEQREALKVDKPIARRPTKVNKTRDLHSGVDDSTCAVKRAEEVQANLSPEFPSFVKSMSKSHVSGGFWLGLPSKFCDDHLPKLDSSVFLVVEDEQEYETKYLVNKNGLSAGWRGFSIKHNLVDGDVVVFQLIEPCKFKLYIVRASKLTEVDGAVALLNLEFHTEQTDAVVEMLQDQPEENSRINTQPDNHHLDQNTAITISDNSGDDTDNSSSPEVIDGITFSESLISFKDVKTFGDFKIHVDGLNLDSEIPKLFRKKYYKLCLSQNMFLHENLITGLNSKLAAGTILETINIADAIRAANFNTGLDHLKSWDTILKGLEDLGMAVGFLRDRINRLVSICRESEVAIKMKMNEKVEAVEKMRALIELTERLDAEIDDLQVKNRELGFVFKEIAGGSW